jgi:hypothetical protein
MGVLAALLGIALLVGSARQHRRVQDDDDDAAHVED